MKYVLIIFICVMTFFGLRDEWRKEKSQRESLERRPRSKVQKAVGSSDAKQKRKAADVKEDADGSDVEKGSQPVVKVEGTAKPKRRKASSKRKASDKRAVAENHIGAAQTTTAHAPNPQVDKDELMAMPIIGMQMLRQLAAEYQGNVEAAHYDEMSMPEQLSETRKRGTAARHNGEQDLQEWENYDIVPDDIHDLDPEDMELNDLGFASQAEEEYYIEHGYEEDE